MSNNVEQEFRSPRLKLRSARRHIASFEEAIIPFAKAITYKRIIEPVGPQHEGLYERWKANYQMQCELEGRAATDPPDRCAYVHKIRFTCPANDELSLIASDVIQNLRQSLDHAVCSCARLNGKTDNGVYFPLIGSNDDLESAIQEKARKVPESIKDIIRNAEPGGGLLYELHQLGIIDKHRLLCDPAQITASASPRSMRASSDGWIASGFGADDWDRPHLDLRYALTGSATELDYEFRFSVNVGFDAPGVIATKPAVAVLGELADTADGVIGEMEAEMKRLLC